MSLKNNYLLLQIFADGGTAGSGAGVGANGAPAADAGQQTGASAQTGAQDPAAGDQKPTFAEMIKGDYKKDFDAAVQEILRPRLKSLQDDNRQMKETGQKWERIADLMGRRYGVNGQTMTPEQIEQTLMADSGFMEGIADKNGISVEAQTMMIRNDWQKADTDRQLQMYRQEQADRQYISRMVREAQDIQAKYPDFNLAEEMRNPLFVERTKSWGVPAIQVYELMHHDEILQKASATAAQDAAAAASQAIAAGSRRPIENGVGSGSPAVTKFDPANMSDEQYRKIREAVKNGERVGPGHRLWG